MIWLCGKKANWIRFRSPKRKSSRFRPPTFTLNSVRDSETVLFGCSASRLGISRPAFRSTTPRARSTRPHFFFADFLFKRETPLRSSRTSLWIFPSLLTLSYVRTSDSRFPTKRAVATVPNCLSRASRDLCSRALRRPFIPLNRSAARPIADLTCSNSRSNAAGTRSNCVAVRLYLLERNRRQHIPFASPAISGLLQIADKRVDHP